MNKKQLIVNEILKKSNKIKLVGSFYRNGKGQDIDFVSTLKPQSIINLYRNIITKIGRSGEKFMSIFVNGVKLDFFIVDNLKFASMLYRQDKGHQIGYKRIAKKQGYVLNQYGLFRHGRKININSLQDLRRVLNIP